MKTEIIFSNNSKIYFVQDPSTALGIKRVAGWVAKDYSLVFDEKPVITESLAAERGIVQVVYGVAGKSPLLDAVISANAIDVSGIVGKREVYGFFPIQSGKLMDGSVADMLVIAGSDKVGTIYGLLHLSEVLGVSPFVNWANLFPEKLSMKKLTEEDTFISHEPSVKYRGFFINDEWPAFGTWCSKHFDGFTARMYETVYELLLRLKGNYLSPAMWSSRFSDDGPGMESALLADELGIVIGLSHSEACLRSGEEYRYLRGEGSIYGDAWNFRTNREGIINFWRDGLKRSGDLSNIIVLGMRGERDTIILEEGSTLTDNADLLRDVLRTQNQLIREEVNPDLKKVPRMLALYKEVEPFFYGNEDEPGIMDDPELDDVLLLMCEDNHGYLRSLPDKKMREHSGGYGMYYHFDYHGDPVSYEWINSTYLPEVWEQMTTAYEYGVRELWVVNVGDLGLQEQPLSYFLDMAYDYDRWGSSNINSAAEYMQSWVERQFGGILNQDGLDKLADTYNRYTRLMHMRRPEHLDDKIYHPVNYHEAARVLEETEKIYKSCSELMRDCREEAKDAFYFLAGYNILGGMNLVQLWIYRSFNHYLAEVGTIAANDYKDKIIECLERDRAITTRLHTSAEGKWDGFGLAEHIGFRNWNSEARVSPVLETVLPVEGSHIMIGTLGETDTVCGREYSRKDMVLRYKKDGTDYMEFFVALIGDTETSFTVSSDSEGVRPDITKGSVSLDEPICYIKVHTDPGASGNVTVDYHEGTAVLKTGCDETAVFAIDAVDYNDTEAKNGRGFVELRDFGRDTGAVKVLPVMTERFSEEDAPVISYSFDVPSDAEYSICFVLEPTSPYSYGGGIDFVYNVNGGKTRRLAVLDKNYAPGVSADWQIGVMDHARYISDKIQCREGTNTISVLGCCPEVVLEKMILVREGEKLLMSYMGPPVRK